MGSSGVLAALTDYFLVKIPATIKTGQYAGQLGSPLTAWLKSYNIMQGNPLAINYAQWLALFRYLMPTVKYWLFDSSRLRLEHLETINAQGWDDLLDNSDKILAIVAQTDDRLIYLG